MSIESDFKKALDYYGAGGSANIELAMSIFNKIAMQEGSAEAAYMLGCCYDKCGDPEKATSWMLMAAEKGIKQAQYDVAIGYEIGKGVPQNYEEAAKWYRKAAAQGVKEAQDSLNELINEGKIKGASPSSTSSNTPPKPAPSSTSSSWALCCSGMTAYNAKDYAKAVELWRKAEEMGDTLSVHKKFYSFSLVDQGIVAYNAKDYAKAVELWKKAADMGDTSAMRNVGVCYEKGQGVAQDYNKAEEWYKKVIAAGDEQGKTMLATLNKKRGK